MNVKKKKFSEKERKRIKTEQAYSERKKENNKMKHSV